MDPLIPPGLQPEEIRARLILESLPGVGLRSVVSLIRRHGSARALLCAGHKRLAAAVGPAAAAAARDRERLNAIDSALDAADRLGMRTTSWGDPLYPPRLLHLVDPPPVLFLRGDVRLLDAPGVAVVGSRRSTHRGQRVAERIGEAVAAAGVPVVSGLALGVDASAHRGALNVEGPTVAVLGRGADRAYPHANRTLFEKIVDGGLVVSEFLPGTRPLRHHFPRRNRVLAGLSGAVVVVEARERSGALITVDHALDLGIDVWAVPGPFEDETCAGSNRLLSDGARTLASLDRFLVELGLGPRPSRDDADHGSDGVSPEEARVLQALSEPGGVDEVARLADLGVPTVLSLLAAMELRGLVEREPGLRFRRAG